MTTLMLRSNSPFLYQHLRRNHGEHSLPVLGRVVMVSEPALSLSKGTIKRGDLNQYYNSKLQMASSPQWIPFDKLRAG
jgi:hypothetical protein